ncbi:MAG TPA: SPOR domain-containing protein, partial [Pusillimonas sp.]
APDPNIGLYGKGGAAGAQPTGPTATAPTPLPGTGGAPAQDNIGDLIASLGNGGKPASAPPAAAPTAPTAPAAPAAKLPPGTEPPAKPPVAAAGAQTTYYLQAGAFRSENDAEAMKARILLLGLPAQVQKAQVNGTTVNRVRVGPFKGIDEMNRSRARLGAEKIDSSVVRP